MVTKRIKGKAAQGDEPEIYGVHIDQNNKSRFNRRDFLKAAALTGAAATVLAGCESPFSSAPTPTPTPTKTSTPTRTPTRTRTRTPTQIDAIGREDYATGIYEGPSFDHPYLGDTVVGEEITILGKTPDGEWYEIRTSDGTTGWIWSFNVVILNDIEPPVIHDFPTNIPSCSCDSYGSCSCVGYSYNTIHYWYPN